MWRCRWHWVRKSVPGTCSGDRERSVSECWTAGTVSCAVAAKRRCRRVMTSDTRWKLLARYSGAMPCRQRYTSTHSLYSVLSRTRNQWSCTSSGVIWLHRRPGRMSWLPSWEVEDFWWPFYCSCALVDSHWCSRIRQSTPQWHYLHCLHTTHLSHTIFFYKYSWNIKFQIHQINVQKSELIPAIITNCRLSVYAVIVCLSVCPSSRDKSTTPLK